MTIKILKRDTKSVAEADAGVPLPPRAAADGAAGACGGSRDDAVAAAAVTTR